LLQGGKYPLNGSFEVRFYSSNVLIRVSIDQLINCLKCYFLFVKPLGTNCEIFFSVHLFGEVFNCVKWVMLGGGGGCSRPWDFIVVQRFLYTYVMDMFWIILVGSDSICVGSYITTGTTRRWTIDLHERKSKWYSPWWPIN
jgi:hypothetical protein